MTWRRSLKALTSQLNCVANCPNIGRVVAFSRNTLICKSIWFCERLTWNPAESPVFDVSRQLNVLSSRT
ncbi:hypothetical protein CSKR_110158 [Clonorchis sinensis]|uniref:Uncharacterized protein n=1 Tax=Clonorchis sinensis TaxID=79923 RepID=A0A3R7JSS9_CLOSI|nr:hypothetical protein CSKR_110158 [Clonorchis sinensis]